MRLTLAVIGRFRGGPEDALYANYAARLPWKITLKELDVKKTMPVPARMEAEAELLLSATEGCGRRVLLDERGKTLSSREFAETLKAWQVAGESDIGFLIGGADGVTEALRKRADLMLSFGRASWPHLLVRGMLMEQCYRAHTILTGHPYHRD